MHVSFGSVWWVDCGVELNGVTNMQLLCSEKKLFFQQYVKTNQHVQVKLLKEADSSFSPQRCEVHYLECQTGTFIIISQEEK